MRKGKGTAMRMAVLVLSVVAVCMTPPALWAAEGAQQRHLRFVAPWPRADRESQRLIRVYTEVFNRLGLTFEVRDVPCRRASERVDSGLVDGELSRVGDYGKHFRNLVRVDEPHHAKPIVAYALRADIHLDGWESLARTGLRVECPRGVVICTDNVSRYVPQILYSENDTAEQSLLRLREGRTDVYISVADRVEWLLDSPDGGGVARFGNVRPVGIMALPSGYMWLHKKHAALAPAIAVILRDMKRDGTFDRLYGDDMPGAGPEQPVPEAFPDSSDDFPMPCDEEPQTHP